MLLCCGFVRWSRAPCAVWSCLRVLIAFISGPRFGCIVLIDMDTSANYKCNHCDGRLSPKTVPSQLTDRGTKPQSLREWGYFDEVCPLGCVKSQTSKVLEFWQYCIPYSWASRIRSRNIIEPLFISAYSLLFFIFSGYVLRWVHVLKLEGQENEMCIESNTSCTSVSKEPIYPSNHSCTKKFFFGCCGVWG